MILLTYISPDERTLPSFRALAAGSDARLMDTDTAGLLRLTGNVAAIAAFEIGSSETLAGKIPAKTLLTDDDAAGR